jgi:hypothetical protein
MLLMAIASVYLAAVLAAVVVLMEKVSHAEAVGRFWRSLEGR